MLSSHENITHRISQKNIKSNPIDESKINSSLMIVGIRYRSKYAKIKIFQDSEADEPLIESNPLRKPMHNVDDLLIFLKC